MRKVYGSARGTVDAGFVDVSRLEPDRRIASNRYSGWPGQFRGLFFEGEPGTRVS
jgi:hypothetical protein